MGVEEVLPTLLRHGLQTAKLKQKRNYWKEIGKIENVRI